VEKPTRREWLLLLAVLLVALGLRLGVIYEQHADVLFEHPALDEQRYVDDARALARGNDTATMPYWQPPGILYALATVLRVAGPGLAAPRVVQALVSTAACLLLFLIARRLFDGRVALGAAAILALHGVVVFESSELLPVTWILTFDLAALALLLWALERKTPVPSFAAGLAFGVSALFSPIVLPFVAVAAIALRRGSLVAALLLGTALPIAPVTWQNWNHGHEVVLVSANGGLNFFLGNNADYASTFALRPGRHWEELTTEPDRNGAHGRAEASSYFLHKGLAFIGERPGQALGLFARKVYLYFNGREIPRDTDVYEARSRSGVLSVLVAPGGFPDAILIPIALVGAALCWGQRRRLAIVYGFLGMQALLVPAFFVTSRHRVPALPLFAMFAAAGVAALVVHWRTTPVARRLAPVAAAAVLAVVLSLPTRESSVSYAAERDFYRGLAELRDLRAPAAAVAPFQQAAAHDPTDARIWFELGNTYDALGRPLDAVDAWRHASVLDPWDSRPCRRISVALSALGDLDGAITALQSNVDEHAREPSHYAPDHLNLAFLRARRGDYGRAIGDLRAGAAEDPGYARTQLPRLTQAALAMPELADAPFWQALGDLDRDVGAAEAARRAWERAAACATSPESNPR
jgi:4-amino-4-deoxy-L-arabinose transferase-like glycosyltransferase